MKNLYCNYVISVTHQMLQRATKLQRYGVQFRLIFQTSYGGRIRSSSHSALHFKFNIISNSIIVSFSERRIVSFCSGRGGAERDRGEREEGGVEVAPALVRVALFSFISLRAFHACCKKSARMWNAGIRPI